MARLASISVGGFFPTPKELMPSIASFFAIENGVPVDHYYNKKIISLFDPCAGEGSALISFYENLSGQKAFKNIDNSFYDGILYFNELELTRFKTLFHKVEESNYRASKNCLNSDAFFLNTQIDTMGLDVLYLNPPYDHDPVYKRLEQAFLTRFTPTLVDHRGWLVFVVPHYVLENSAEFIAKEYQNVQVFKFPEPLFSQFKQVVMYAQKGTLDKGNFTNVVNMLTMYSRESGTIPILPSFFSKPVKLQPHSNSGFTKFEVQTIDYQLIYDNYIPFGITDKHDANYLKLGLDLDIKEGLQKKYQVVMPPKPGHIAYGIASGVFNGVVLTPNKGCTLPKILVKGVFHKKYKTVDEKYDKEGALVSETQVQQPEMKVYALDLESYIYFELKDSISVSEVTKSEDLTLGDLIDKYGESLYSVLLEQCNPLHNPKKDAILPLPLTKRELMLAQKHAYSASLKVLQSGRNVLLDGEVGSGKSIITIAITEALSKPNIQSIVGDSKVKPIENVLVLCPPHLIENWTDEINKTVPGATIVHIEKISDLNKIKATKENVPGGHLAFGLLSRETAKLGSALEVGTNRKFCLKCHEEKTKIKKENTETTEKIEPCTHIERCPSCSKKIDKEELDILGKRLRCSHTSYTPTTKFSQNCMSLFRYTNILFDNELSELFTSNSINQESLKFKNKQEYVYSKLIGSNFNKSILSIWIKNAFSQSKQFTTLLDSCIGFLLWLKPEHRPQALKTIMSSLRSNLIGIKEEKHSKIADSLENCIITVSLLDKETVDSVLSDFDSTISQLQLPNDGKSESTLSVRKTINYLKRKADLQQIGYYGYDNYNSTEFGVVEYKVEAKDPVFILTYKTMNELHRDDLLLFFITKICTICKFSKKKCGEFLYQTTASPRRYPIATYISRHRKDLFDFVVLDEVQEYSTDGSAQEKAAHRLSELGVPVMALSGSIMNGYAKSLFRNFWALFPHFREEFSYDDERPFVNIFGYKKQIIDHKNNKTTNNDVVYGAVTDRTQKSLARQSGDAPGVLPTFIMKYLLPSTVVIHKADLEKDLPKCTEVPSLISLDESPKIRDEYDNLLQALKERIKADRFNPDLQGKLLGALAEIPSYLDRCIYGVGNTDNKDHYIMKYPDNVGAMLIEKGKLFPREERTPKEKWLLDHLKSELEAGRNCIVFMWHTGNNNVLPKRLQEIIAIDLNEESVFLDATKVLPKKRQEWINKEILKKQKRVLLVNPVSVQTGLNNLVWFSTAIWLENPACNAIIYRQANGRLDRIGQTKEVKIIFPYYVNTIQELVYKLLLKKVVVSMQSDGLDASASLVAAGVESRNSTDSLSIGKLLYDHLFAED